MASLARRAPREDFGGVARELEGQDRPAHCLLRGGRRGSALFRLDRRQGPAGRRRAHNDSVLPAPPGQPVGAIQQRAGRAFGGGRQDDRRRPTCCGSGPRGRFVDPLRSGRGDGHTRRPGPGAGRAARRPRAFRCVLTFGAKRVSWVGSRWLGAPQCALRESPGRLLRPSEGIGPRRSGSAATDRAPQPQAAPKPAPGSAPRTAALRLPACRPGSRAWSRRAGRSSAHRAAHSRRPPLPCSRRSEPRPRSDRAFRV